LFDIFKGQGKEKEEEKYAAGPNVAPKIFNFWFFTEQLLALAYAVQWFLSLLKWQMCHAVCCSLFMPFLRLCMLLTNMLRTWGHLDG
jgi:hypothetical protein